MQLLGTHHRLGKQGFTLIELLVVMAIVSLLASLAAPRFVRSLEVAQERALQSSLATLRDAIDHFVADRGEHPASLEELARLRYLREVPPDPVTGRRDTWVTLAPTSPAGNAADSAGPPAGVGDVRSGAAGRGSDGRLYADW
jgi:general secretion pathway protein G